MSLFDAVDRQDLEALAQALKTSRDVNELRDGRQTPLIAAAQAGWLAGVHALLGAGAEPGWKDSSEETALLKAAANGHGKVAAALLKFADADEQHLAKSFLAAFGSSAAPEFEYDESRLKRGAVELAARAADFLGHENPLERVERVKRADDLKKKQ